MLFNQTGIIVLALTASLTLCGSIYLVLERSGTVEFKGRSKDVEVQININGSGKYSKSNRL